MLFLSLIASLSAATFGTAVPVVGGATDLALDEARSRLYVVNNTQQRIDVFTTTQPRLTTSIPVDPQPLSSAMSRDGKFLYVTSYGGSLLDVIDLGEMTVVKRVSLPAAPEGVAVGGDGRVLITPSALGQTMRKTGCYSTIPTSRRVTR